MADDTNITRYTNTTTFTPDRDFSATIVLLGGVSIFGGSGSIYGVILSILIVLYLRNGMSLSNITGHLQTGVIGVLLILSVLIPNVIEKMNIYLKFRKLQH